MIKDENSKGIKVLRIAAFSLAIVSWMATAQGLENYDIFIYSWQSYLVSFAIQSILLIFNLQLPQYIAWAKEYQKDKVKALKKNIIILFYVVALLTSSFFSYVYIVNTIYAGTIYVDANIELDSTYREMVYDADKYIREYKTYLEDSGYDGSEETKEELQESLTKAERRFDKRLKALLEEQKRGVYSDEQYRKYRDDLDNWIKEQRQYYGTQLANNMENEAQENESEMTPETKNIIKKEIEDLDSCAKNINEFVQDLSDKEKNSVDIPDTKAVEKEKKKQVKIWKDYWSQKFRNIEQTIKALPEFTEDINDGREVITNANVALLRQYNINDKSKEMDKVQRKYLEDLNKIERAKNLLFSPYPTLAWFSAIFALILDLFSLLAGYFIFIISKNTKI